MAHKPTYFLCPHFDYPPSSISLGHIISSPSDPSNALNQDELVPPDSSQIASAYKEDFKSVLSSTRGGREGIMEKFLRVFGFGSETEYRDNSEDRFDFDRLTTTYFRIRPTRAYLNRAIQAEGVQMFLAASRFRKPLYMITGVKVVSGARSKGKGIEGHLPDEMLNVAPGVQVAPSWSASQSFQTSSDFVIAFKLSRLIFKAKDVLQHKFDVDLGDAGTAGVRDVVAEEVLDDAENKRTSIVLYSAESYTKGAMM